MAATAPTKKTNWWAELKADSSRLWQAARAKEDPNPALLRADSASTHHLQLLSTPLPVRYAINFTKCCTCQPGPRSGRKNVSFSKLQIDQMLCPGLLSSSGLDRLKYHLPAHLCRCFLPCCRQRVSTGWKYPCTEKAKKNKKHQKHPYPRLRSSPWCDVKAST